MYSNMRRVLLFAGTTEGRELAEYLSACGAQVIACVATEYGQTLIHEGENLSVHAGRLDEDQMVELMRSTAFDFVVDATHPYAAIVTENIARACQKVNLPYYRCLRERSEDSWTDYEKLICVENTEQAAEKLNEIEGNILLTTGSKELAQYRNVAGFSERIYPRVLPLENVVASCIALGIPPAHLIAMQGPFGEELNLAMIRQWNIQCLVSKESGKAGGFREKVNAVRKAGITLLMIGRPQEKEQSYSLEQLKTKLRTEWGLQPSVLESDSAAEQAAQKYFPMFVSLKDKQVQVVGAGKIAARRIKTLLRFGCQVQVIAPELGEQCRELLEQGKITWENRCWHAGDCTAEIVLAATDAHDVNEEIVQECRRKHILVNRCDRQQDCDFYFPAVVESDGLVLGLCSGGADHKKVKDTAAQLRNYFAAK